MSETLTSSGQRKSTASKRNNILFNNYIVWGVSGKSKTNDCKELATLTKSQNIYSKVRYSKAKFFRTLKS